jgi:hypothetical protein
MATTIQVSEDLEISRYIEIGGKKCTVESFSHSQYITEGNEKEELLSAMEDELTERGIIKKNDDGKYYFCKDGSPLIDDEE